MKQTFMKNELKKGKRASYWLSAEVLEKLERLSKKHSLSKSEIIRQLVTNVKED